MTQCWWADGLSYIKADTFKMVRNDTDFEVWLDEDLNRVDKESSTVSGSLLPGESFTVGRYDFTLGTTLPRTPVSSPKEMPTIKTATISRRRYFALKKQ